MVTIARDLALAASAAAGCKGVTVQLIWAHAAVSKMHAAYRGLCRRFLLRLDEMTVMTIASCASVHV